MNEISARDFGRLEAEVQQLKRDVGEMKRHVSEMRDILLQARGGWRALVAVRAGRV